MRNMNPFQLPYSTRLINFVGRAIALGYARRMMRADVQFDVPLAKGAKIVVANHPTTTDPFLMMAWPLEPIFILITEVCFKIPGLALFLRSAGHIPVRARNGHAAFEHALHLLRAGYAVGLFPEGALSEEDGMLRDAHTGAVRLAYESGAPLVPVGLALDHSFVHHTTVSQSIPETARWFWLGGYEATVGAPIHLSTPTFEAEAFLATQIMMSRIDALAMRSAQRLLQRSQPRLVKHLHLPVLDPS